MSRLRRRPQPQGVRRSPAVRGHQADVQGRRVVILVRTQGEVVCDASGAPITSWNPAAEQLYGYTAGEIVGTSAAKLMPPDREDEDRQLLERVLAGGRVEDFETQCRRRDGELIDVSLSVSPVLRDGGLVGVSAIARDITERKRFEERLQWLADHDPLTGLFNRRRFEEELNAHAARAARYRASSALMLIDLDNLKYVNDTAGHSAGDVLIHSLACALSRRLRATDVLARLGGDEFAVLVPQAKPRDAKALATELLEIVRNHATAVGGYPLRTTASIGLVLCPPGSDTGEALLAAADRAMYEAMDAGRDRLAVHSLRDCSLAPRGTRSTWEHRINQALDGDLFELYSQPIVDLRTGAASRHELLLRMRDGDELVGPAAFLGVAERLGLIHRIDRWVVREAIGLLAACPDLHLEVNLSGCSMDDSELPRLIRNDLDAAGVDPTHLVFEITETAAIANIDDARRFARALGDLGCRFALDDFGAGFGSFTYLKHLPVDLLKIDGEFVRGPRSLANDLIVEAIVGVARGLGKQTVAEWISDAQTADRIREAGVDYGQGSFLGVPTPVSSLLAVR